MVANSVAEYLSYLFELVYGICLCRCLCIIIWIIDMNIILIVSLIVANFAAEDKFFSLWM